MFLLRRVVGVSMLPAFRPGTLLLASQFKRPAVGDVIIARHGTIEIVKRIEQISEKGYFLRGDNPSESTDSRAYGWFDKATLKGVVIRSFTR